MSAAVSIPSDVIHSVYRTHCRIEGDGRWVVLIHGVGLDLDMWSAQAAALSKDWCVLRYDLIGHGNTPPAGDSLSLADLVSQLHELFRALGIERATLVGFSLGALVAQAFTLAHASMVEKLALVSGVYQRSDAALTSVRARLEQVEREGIASTITASIERWFTGDFQQRYPAEVESIRHRLRNNAPGGFLPAYRMFANADAELAERLGEIQAPTLVVTGEHDVGSTPEMARRMSEEIPGARLRIFPGVRHLLPIEAASEFNAVLDGFLSSQDDEP